ncbi:MAG: hypothetical protein DMG36_19020 [Acidobacteria bacterium]|nr:MAG: hypothetical protein DMG36_19020 [Acidobacteriota bacterium]
MLATQHANRRGFMKMLAASPLLAQIAAQGLYEKSAAAFGLDLRGNVYSRLGVKTVINCRGTWTYLSGSLQFPEVQQAQAEASRHFVNMVDLHHAVGERLAELTGAESGLITSGAAGAMAAATAACMAGSDPKKIWQLPDTTGLKHEVIMVGGRSAFDNAIRLAGAKLVLVEKPDDIASAITGNTAMIYTTDLGDKLAREAAIAKDYNVPLLLDDAAGIPPIDNIKLYAKMKLDLYTFSGGKGLRGPQCSGVLLGRKDLIEAALRNSCPFEGAVCRPMKVGKEEVIGTHTEIYIPDDGNRYPTLRITWDQEAWGFNVAECAKKLHEGDPVIEVLSIDNPSMVPAVQEGTDKPKPNPKEPKKQNHIELVSMTIQPGEEMIVGRRLRTILSAARQGKPA